MPLYISSFKWKRQNNSYLLNLINTVRVGIGGRAFAALANFERL